MPNESIKVTVNRQEVKVTEKMVERAKKAKEDKTLEKLQEELKSLAGTDLSRRELRKKENDLYEKIYQAEQDARWVDHVDYNKETGSFIVKDLKNTRASGENIVFENCGKVKIKEKNVEHGKYVFNNCEDAKVKIKHGAASIIANGSDDENVKNSVTVKTKDAVTNVELNNIKGGSVKTGTKSDTILTKNCEGLSIKSGAGNDKITDDNSYNLFIKPGSGEDKVSLNGTKHVDVNLHETAGPFQAFPKEDELSLQSVNGFFIKGSGDKINTTKTKTLVSKDNTVKQGSTLEGKEVKVELPDEEKKEKTTYEFNLSENQKLKYETMKEFTTDLDALGALDVYKKTEEISSNITKTKIKK